MKTPRFPRIQKLAAALLMAAVIGGAGASAFAFDCELAALASIHDDPNLVRDQDYFERFERYELAKTDDERFAAVTGSLDELGVKYEVVSRRHLWFFTEKYIHILPAGFSALNKLARNISEKYSAILSFEPLTANQLAFYVSAQNRIALPIDAVLSGEIGMITLHELRHMGMTFRENAGRTPLFNGTMTKIPGTKWPWGEASRSGYANYMSFQEIATWSQGSEYSIRRLLKRRRTPGPGWSAGTTVREAKLLLEDGLKAVRFERKALEDGKLVVNRNSKGKVLIGMVGWNYFLSQTIPGRFIGAEDEPLDLAAGRYLKAMEETIARRLDRLERFLPLEDN